MCTSVSRDDSDGGGGGSAKRRPPPAAAPATPRKLVFFSGMGGSNPSAPALRCRTKPTAEPESVAPVTPPPQQPASAPVSARKRMPLLQAILAPSSPRSPSRFTLFKASILPTKARCEVCTRGVKDGGAAAVFTADCSHSFHFPCIAAHARAAASGALCCPMLCNFVVSTSMQLMLMQYFVRVGQGRWYLMITNGLVQFQYMISEVQGETDVGDAMQS
ncbi:hypothetical protein D1007_08294 [Hordeum vulgare]|nr:hypothetical protein D1007_08294 [Hordeum vulgare]